MKILRRIPAALGVVTGVALLAMVLGAEKGPKRTDTEVFMRTKLIHASAALEGLSLEKFDLVSGNAIKLRNMTQSNLWFTSRQPDYMAHTSNYHRCADRLYMAAVDRDLGAATEAYVEVARACVECHRLVRVEQYRKTIQSNN